MKKLLVRAAIAGSVILAVGGGRLYGADAKPVSRAELHQMTRNAHTGDQYRELAEYYRSKQSDYEQQARVERAQWLSLRLGAPWAMTKAPTPVDFARNWYEILNGRAEKMSAKAQYFEDLEDRAQ